MAQASPYHRIFPPLHQEGYKFTIIFAAITTTLFFLWQPLGWLGVVGTLWCVAFFRDPHRVSPQGKELVLSPADGIFLKTVKAVPPVKSLSTPRQKISIFMNVFNCHVNRSPMAGIVAQSLYHKGKFFNAAWDKASTDNERQVLVIDLPQGKNIIVVQIAGLLARRIVCDAGKGTRLKAGGRFGIIRFGSRVDVYLPQGYKVLVKEGQVSVGGETVIARIK